MGLVNVGNRTVFCRDNLDVLRGVNSGSVDLIYLDPPFNKKKMFTASVGSGAEGAGFRDCFRREDIDDEWVLTIEEDNEKLHNFLSGVKNIDGKNSYNYCYLCYMAIRLIEIHRILKKTGSVYLHCDPTMSHYLKILLDCIFGEKNFRNEIVWCYSRPSAPKQRQLSRVHDIVLWYSKGDKWVFDPDVIRQKYADSSLSREGYVANKSKMTAGTPVELSKAGKFPESWVYIPPLKGNAKEYVGYPTQKPLALLDRILRAGSRKGDVVLDPFCGCATTCIAAEKLGRRWIGVDISVMAYELIKKRADKEIRKDLWDAKAVNFSTVPPVRTDRGRGAVERKFVYVISNPQYKGYYKVGVAANAKNRLNSYQTGDPARKYKLEFSLKVGNYRETEKFVHDKFENNHEWVRADLGDVVRAIKGYGKK